MTAWIGLSDSASELDWVWTDASNYNWNYWKNGTLPVRELTQNCVYSSDDGFYMEWQHRICTDTINYICQMRQTDYGDGMRNNANSVHFSQR